MCSACIVLATLAFPSSIHAESQGKLEARVKAHMLILFPKYVDWPSSRFGKKTDPILMGVLGDTIVHSELLKAAKKRGKVKGRSIEVRKLDPNDWKTPAKKWSGFHILYIPEPAKVDVAAIAAFATKRNILTVSDKKGFNADGGVIEFLIVNRKVKFSISAKAAKASKIRISARLLKLGVTR